LLRQAIQDGVRIHCPRDDKRARRAVAHAHQRSFELRDGADQVRLSAQFVEEVGRLRLPER
jgi:hypothetical protein